MVFMCQEWICDQKTYFMMSVSNTHLVMSLLP